MADFNQYMTGNFDTQVDTQADVGIRYVLASLPASSAASSSSLATSFSRLPASLPAMSLAGQPLNTHNAFNSNQLPPRSDLLPTHFNLDVKQPIESSVLPLLDMRVIIEYAWLLDSDELFARDYVQEPENSHSARALQISYRQESINAAFRKIDINRLERNEHLLTDEEKREIIKIYLSARARIEAMKARRQYELEEELRFHHDAERKALDRKDERDRQRESEQIFLELKQNLQSLYDDAQRMYGTNGNNGILSAYNYVDYSATGYGPCSYGGYGGCEGCDNELFESFKQRECCDCDYEEDDEDAVDNNHFSI